jgi:hypothetical protein
MFVKTLLRIYLTTRFSNPEDHNMLNQNYVFKE